MYTRKQHILRKSMIILVSFVFGIVTTVIAAATYDANIQARADKIFATIKSNASSMDPLDVTSYYTLVRKNIASLMQVLTVVDDGIATQLGEIPGLDDDILDDITNTGTTNTGTTNTGTIGSGTTTPVCARNGSAGNRIASYPDSRALCYAGSPTHVDTGATDGYFDWKCSNALGASTTCSAMKIPTNETVKNPEIARCRQQGGQDYYSNQIVSRDKKPTNAETCTFPSFLSGEPVYATKPYPNLSSELNPTAGNWSWNCILPSSTTKKEIQCQTALEYSHTIVGGTDVASIDSGCKSMETYFARPAFTSANNLPGYNYVWNQASASAFIGATILYVCSEDSKLNNNSSDKFAFEDIAKACKSGYHPMERWELDMLGGNTFYALGEQGTVQGGSPRFRDVNSTNITHWLWDNVHDNNNSYSYIQGSNDMESVPSGELKVRCVRDNGVGRDGKSKMTLAGCATIRKDAASGIEYCAGPSNLRSDYSSGSQISGETRSSRPNSSASVTINSEIICPDGYDFPTEPMLFSKISGLYVGAKTFELGNYKVSLTKMENGYAIRNYNAVMGSSDGGTVVNSNNWMILDTRKSIYDVLRTSYVQDNDLIKLSDQVRISMEKNEIGGVCMKKGSINDTYNVKLSGCETTKKLGNREVCSEFSAIGKCMPGYKEAIATDFKYFSDNQLLIRRDSRGNGDYSSNLPVPKESCTSSTSYQHIATTCTIKAQGASKLGYNAGTYSLSQQNSNNNSTVTYSFSTVVNLRDDTGDVLCMKDTN